MGMCLGLVSISDNNIQKILQQPELIWRLLALDDPEMYQAMLKEKSKPGFFSRLFGKKQLEKVEMSDLDFVAGENIHDDLDKAWHGIHYCLNKTAYEAEPPLDFITVGGEVTGDIDVGYGPARLLDSQAVRDIHASLSGVSEKEFSDNYNPEEMHELDIYPNIWDRDDDDGLEYITEYFKGLKSFIAECEKHKLGMAIYLS